MVGLRQDLRHDACANRPSTLTDREPQLLFHCDRRDEFDRHLHVVARHDHLRSLRQRDRTRHVETDRRARVGAAVPRRNRVRQGPTRCSGAEAQKWRDYDDRHSPLFRRKKTDRGACRQTSVAGYLLPEGVCR